MSRDPHLPCAACQRMTPCEWLIPVSIQGEQDTFLCDVDGCRECARCDQGIVEGEELVRLADGRLAHRAHQVPVFYEDMTVAQDVRGVKPPPPSYSIPFNRSWRNPMADEKRKRRGRVPTSERLADIDAQIKRCDDKKAALLQARAHVVENHKARIAAMEAELQ